MSKRKKQIPEFVVLSREDAERYEPHEREICISIADPDADPAHLSSNFAAVLRLNFTDIIEQGDPSDVLFGEDHARAIREFVDAWPDAPRIVVHCHAGMSRSPGVALGLCDIRGWATAQLERSHPGWNRLVRTALAAERHG
ncbi:MAG TPA: hypothetical protein VGQ98_06075 [Gemmatimonadaceae bacterium]|nr:hypothetical protein [Gemmatimonadaceae bacterium]